MSGLRFVAESWNLSAGKRHLLRKVKLAEEGKEA